jgi:hypothetical protein
MIAFTTYLPFIRDKVVKTYRVTKIDWMLITVLLINLLTLIRSFLNYRNPEIVYNWTKDPFVLISIISLSSPDCHYPRNYAVALSRPQEEIFKAEGLSA